MSTASWQAPPPSRLPNSDCLAAWVQDARSRTLALIADLSEAQLSFPPHPILNPLLWEVGHIAWFQEYWVLRGGGRTASMRTDADTLFDSARVEHYSRWHQQHERGDIVHYAETVRDRVLDRLDDTYYVMLSVFHEDMHDENLAASRQSLACRAPALSAHPPPLAGAVSTLGDVEVGGGTYLLGATTDEPFVFDNEKWAHAVVLRPFRIARTAVTQRQFADFVEDGGYERHDWWDEDGWTWRQASRASAPLYWERAGDAWFRRHFDQVVPLEPQMPMHHVNWFEASAYCRWAGRRLPTEAEWEAAASLCGGVRRRYPWGSDPPQPHHANLNWRVMDCVDVAAMADGDSAAGCRQMLGNVWEWTSSDFLPYPGFVEDPYKEYSRPWFGTHKVLRGGSWATTARLLRNTWRNFYLPHRRDIWAGLRTCPLS